MAEPEMLTVAEVAALLRVSEKSVREWVKSGRLPAIRIGKVIRIPRSSVQP